MMLHERDPQSPLTPQDIDKTIQDLEKLIQEHGEAIDALVKQREAEESNGSKQGN